MGATAVIRVALDNQRNCKFEQILLDATTFCFVHECSLEITAANFSTNWAEDIYAFNMIWTTIVSGFFSDNELETCYHYYYKLGDSVAVLLDDIIGYKPKDAYVYREDANSEKN